jgi:predicted peptidase
MPQHKHAFERQINRSVSLQYLLYTPPDYQGRDGWPLVLFLHGRGERGANLDHVKRHGLPRLIEEGQDFPFVIVSPQCPVTTVWPEQVETLNALLDVMLETLKINPARVYLTGLSMGGFGTWHLASRYPERFAAIAPICGGGDWWMFEALQHLPAWVFHGEADDVVPLAASQRMVDGLRERGADVRFTVYPEVGHNSWDRAYNEAELIPWLLSHSR